MCDMETTTKSRKQGTGSWYTEKGTTREPCTFDSSLEWICRAGKYIALVPKKES